MKLVAFVFSGLMVTFTAKADTASSLARKYRDLNLGVGLGENQEEAMGNATFACLKKTPEGNYIPHRNGPIIRQVLEVGTFNGRTVVYVECSASE